MMTMETLRTTKDQRTAHKKTMKTRILILTLSVLIVGFYTLAEAATNLDGLLLYLPFDEGTGNQAQDTSGNGYHGTLQRAKWTQGKFGGAVEFDGSSYVAVNPLADLPLSLDEFTIEFWFSPDKKLDTGSPRIDIVYALKGCCRPHVTFNRADELPPGVIGFYPEFGEAENPNDGPGIPLGTKNTEFWPNTWYHFAATANGTEAKLYLDGQLQSKTAAPEQKVRITYREHGISIGALAGIQNFYEGKIDEFRLWHRVLTDDEIQQFATIGLAVKAKDKLAMTWGALKHRK
jgi:hypothetical protein